MIFIEQQLYKINEVDKIQDPCHHFPVTCFILPLTPLEPSESEGFLFYAPNHICEASVR